MEEEETDAALGRGSEGQAVTDLQEMLIELRFKPGEVDGVFGPLTESAVKLFQTSVDTESDGVVGPLTLERLNQASGREHEVDAG
ncbi:MAG: peptidoglycan-binding protein [Actinomycetota bacterium]|nr:peptidoglycan-binding protein [Actinomycetota bacterium]